MAAITTVGEMRRFLSTMGDDEVIKVVEVGPGEKADRKHIIVDSYVKTDRGVFLPTLVIIQTTQD